MGAKQTKIEGSYLPSTPVAQSEPLQSIMKFNGENVLSQRSPPQCKKPKCLSNKRTDANIQLHTEYDTENTENALDAWRKRFLKGFSYNLNDPRSPSRNLNRTPLVFEDTFEKSLRLDDTFSDLLIEPHLPEVLNEIKPCDDIVGDKKCEDQDLDIDMPEEKLIVDLEESINAPNTPLALKQNFDPRSPSIGVERTPIMFSDDEVDETSEDAMLENILETLTLNLNTSGNSSVVSIKSQEVNVDFKNTNEIHPVSKPTNKHLDRVRIGKKGTAKVTHRKLTSRLSRQQIYEDTENQTPTTPKLKTQFDKNDSFSMKGKRTPLGCIRNRTASQARSKSVESSEKSMKTRLALTSFDDTLNPTDSHKVTNLRIMQQGAQYYLEL